MPSVLDSYTHSFMYSRCANRENCLTCEFRNTHYSDFIIADYWRWFEYSNLKNDETGISLILTNSDKAELLMEYIKKEMYLEKQDINKAMYNCYVKPPVTETFLKKREKFWADLKESDLKKAAIHAGMGHGVKAFVHKMCIISSKGSKGK